VCYSDSILSLHPIHDSLVACQSGSFSVIFTSESQFNYLFIYKNVLKFKLIQLFNKTKYIIKFSVCMAGIFLLKTVNLVTQTITIIEIMKFPTELFLLVHPVHSL